MGLEDYAKAGQVGLIGSSEDFDEEQLKIVNALVQGAQAAFRVDRATGLASSTVHLSINELPPGTSISSTKEGKRAICNPSDESKTYSLGMRAVLAGRDI